MLSSTNPTTTLISSVRRKVAEDGEGCSVLLEAQRRITRDQSTQFHDSYTIQAKWGDASPNVTDAQQVPLAVVSGGTAMVFTLTHIIGCSFPTVGPPHCARQGQGSPHSTQPVGRTSCPSKPHKTRDDAPQRHHLIDLKDTISKRSQFKTKSKHQAQAPPQYNSTRRADLPRLTKDPTLQ